MYIEACHMILEYDDEICDYYYKISKAQIFCLSYSTTKAVYMKFKDEWPIYIR